MLYVNIITSIVINTDIILKNTDVVSLKIKIKKNLYTIRLWYKTNVLF